MIAKPEAFQQAHIALQNIPYLFGEDASRQSTSGGVLGRGQTIWTKESHPVKTRAHSIIGFVEGIGVISLTSRALVRADIFTNID